MERRRAPWTVAATLVALGATVVGVALGAGAAPAASGGTIVFASDRAKVDPGEIYALAPGAAPRDISRSLAAESYLAVAPAGDLIAFWSDRGGDERVYLAHPDGSRLRVVRTVGGGAALASTEAQGTSPLSFSADGSTLVAWTARTPTSGKTTWHDFVVDTRTATARMIRTACAGVFQPAPDGKAIACAVRGGTTVYDLAGHVRATLTGTYPLWSSRGWLADAQAVTSARPVGSAVVVDESGATRGRVTGTPLGWSPDGQLLVVARGQTLWASATDDLAHARILLRGWPGGRVSFTPDSRYVSTEGPGDKAVLVPLEGGPAIAGLDGGGGAWSRDGRVAYLGGLPTGPYAPGVTLSVFVTDTHGRHPRVVGRFPFDDHAAADLRWQPDGRRVLFLTASYCGGNGLFAVSAGGGPARALTNDPRNVGGPSWSPDGKTIAYTVQPFNCHLGDGAPVHLETIAADGTAPHRVTDDGDANAGSFDGFPAFSPDGARIAFSHGTFSSFGMQVVAADGTGPRMPMPPDVKPEVGTLAWSPDGSTIAYDDSLSIMTVASAGGVPQKVLTNPDDAGCLGGSGVAWSPDGTRLAIGGNAGIWLVTLGQPATAELAIRAPCAADPAFSPDGTEIAFDAPPAHPLGRETAIMVARTDGSDLHVLSAVPFHQSVHPAWRPAP